MILPHFALPGICFPRSGNLACLLVLPERSGHPIYEATGRLPIPALPPRQRARIDTDLAGKFLLRQAERFAMIDQTMCHCVSILNDTEPEKSRRPVKAISSLSAASFLSICRRTKRRFSRLPMLTRLVAYVAAAATLNAAPVEIIPPDLRGAVQPQVAVAPSGRIHIVFGKDNAIYHTTSSDGRVCSPPVKIGELEKLALRMRRGPRVTATDKLVVVTAISHADGNLHAWTSSDIGKSWQEAAPLNSIPKSAREGLHALAGDGRGLAAVVWLDLRGEGKGLWGRVSHDGGATWEAESSIYESPDGHICECCVPNVAISPNGEIAAMWRNWLRGSRDFYMTASRDGRGFSPATKLGVGTWKLNGCPMDGGYLTFSSAGNWLAVWRRERSVFASDASSPEKQLADDAMQPVAGFAGKTPLVLWETSGVLMLQRGTAAPARFASGAASASIASGTEAASIVWESSDGGLKTLLFDHIR